MTDIIAYCLEHMASKEMIYALFDSYDIHYRKTDSYKKLADSYRNAGKQIDIARVRDMLRNAWRPAPLDYHFNNLTSGALIGHSWHGAMPSSLHLSLQDKVRHYIGNLLPLDGLVNIGADIIKHEYFMVATHDILETTIIQQFTSSIPPAERKSISDFVFMDIPYDLKVSTFPAAWQGSRNNLTTQEQCDLIVELFSGADSDRIRKDAEKAVNNWGLNRFYVIIENQARWLENPRLLQAAFIEKVSQINDHLKIKIGEYSACFQLVIL